MNLLRGDLLSQRISIYPALIWRRDITLEAIFALISMDVDILFANDHAEILARLLEITQSLLPGRFVEYIYNIVA